MNFVVFPRRDGHATHMAKSRSIRNTLKRIGHLRSTRPIARRAHNILRKPPLLHLVVLLWLSLLNLGFVLAYTILCLLTCATHSSRLRLVMKLQWRQG